MSLESIGDWFAKLNKYRRGLPSRRDLAPLVTISCQTLKVDIKTSMDAIVRIGLIGDTAIRPFT